MEYKWYEELTDSDDITQGDILLNCPVAILDPYAKLSEGAEIKTEIKYIDGIIVTQACDIANKKTDNIVICSLITKAEAERQFELAGKKPKDIKNSIKNIVKGQVVSKHIINNYISNTYNQDYYIIDFNSIYTIPMQLAKEIAKQNSPRLRLCPPYREHLSQSFARFFMRVGLPINIQIYSND